MRWKYVQKKYPAINDERTKSFFLFWPLLLRNGKDGDPEYRWLEIAKIRQYRSCSGEYGRWLDYYFENIK